ncbi:MAG: DegQ family serine endoprotease [candidate division NC10 bacterium]|nr:DegQ family serine endoprotease [candidate division NC10 bacterium]
MSRMFRASPCSVLLVGFLLLTQTPSALAAKLKEDDALATLQAIQEAFVQVAEAVKPTVVNISTTQKVQFPGQRIPPFIPEPFRDFFGPDFFERFFGDIPPRELERRSLGSGVLVEKRGYILTNNHVVAEAEEIEVQLSDKRKLKGRVIGRDAKTDLAVIKIDASGDLPVARLGDSSQVRIGEWAIAIGNPFGLDQTVTVGVISATGRSDVGIATYEDFIQTDASINPGNSGGPLLNIKGEVIGINTAIVASGQGIGFAIPINMAREIMERLIVEGRVVRGWLGISIQDLTDELAAQFHVKPGSGVLVGNVMQESPAEQGGIRVGDIIREYDGTKVGEVRQLQRLVAETPVGKVAAVKVLRDGKELTLSIKTGEMPAEEVASSRDLGERYGFAVQELTPDLRERLRLRPDIEGVLVAWVDPGGPAARVGLRRSDVIVEVNREQVRTVAEFEEAVRRAGGVESLLLLVVREQVSRFVAIPPKDGRQR